MMQKIARTGVMVLMLAAITFAIGGCSPKEDIETGGSNKTVSSLETTETNKTGSTSSETSTKMVSEMPIQGKTKEQLSAKQSQALNAAYTNSDRLSHVLEEYLIQEVDNSQFFDIRGLDLMATFESDQSINQVMHTLIPSFNPENYVIRKTENNETGDDFVVDYILKVGEYETSKGYVVIYNNNQAIEIREGGVSFSVPSNAVISDLPAVTNEVIQAAYQQGRNEVRDRNPNYVVQEQRGRPFYDLLTNECVYYVTTIYTTSAKSNAKGTVSTQYKISSMTAVKSTSLQREETKPEFKTANPIPGIAHLVVTPEIKKNKETILQCTDNLYFSDTFTEKQAETLAKLFFALEIQEVVEVNIVEKIEIPKGNGESYINYTIQFIDITDQDYYIRLTHTRNLLDIVKGSGDDRETLYFQR